jgi:hypothetical protein
VRRKNKSPHPDQKFVLVCAKFARTADNRKKIKRNFTILLLLLLLTFKTEMVDQDSSVAKIAPVQKEGKRQILSVV